MYYFDRPFRVSSFRERAVQPVVETTRLELAIDMEIGIQKGPSFLFKRVHWKMTWTLTIEDSDFHPDDHFESHLLGVGFKELCMYIHICMYLGMRAHVYIYMYMYIYMYTYIRTFKKIPIYIHVMSMYSYIYIGKYICMYIYMIYTHVYVYIYKCICMFCDIYNMQISIYNIQDIYNIHIYVYGMYWLYTCSVCIFMVNIWHDAYLYHGP